MVKYEAKKTLINKDYKGYMLMINEYIKEGGAFDAEMIMDFASALISLNKKEEAMTILKNFAKIANSDYIKVQIAQYMVWCFKPIDALQVLLSVNNQDKFYYYELGKTYLLMGEINKAKDAFISSLSLSNRQKHTEKCQDRLKEIENHIARNAFIETEYDCFIENGGTLEPGHIVFLKHGLELKNESDLDLNGREMSRIRPYLIWRIDGETIYTFPVTKKPVYTSNHCLSSKDYPNSKGDRYIKKNIGVTNVENILSIKDKVPASEVLAIMKDIYEDSFESSSSYERSERLTFLKHYIGEIKQYDIIEYLDITTKTIRRLFVIDKDESGYKTLEVDDNTGNLKGVLSFISNDDASIYKVKKLSKDAKEKLLSEVSKTMEEIKKSCEI